MKFYVNNFEELEDKEKWENLFVERKIQFRVLSGEIARAYDKVGLDSSLWENISISRGDLFSVEKKSSEWVTEKFIPDIEKGIKILTEKGSKDVIYDIEFLIDSLKQILKIAKTCSRLKRGIVIDF